MSWLDLLGARFLDRVVGNPDGHAFILAFLAYAEESDEAGIFDNLLARVDDPELGKLVRRHRDDEENHARLLRGCLARTGILPLPIPPELRYIDRLDRMAGGFAADFVVGKRGVMEAYVLLQVIEERGVRQFPFIARALDRVDRESAAVLRGIIRDEERHVRYARAVARRYAADAASYDRMLRRYREIEARAFADHNRALTRFTLDNELLAVAGVEKLLWRALAALEERRFGSEASRSEVDLGATRPIGKTQGQASNSHSPMAGSEYEAGTAPPIARTRPSESSTISKYPRPSTIDGPSVQAPVAGS